MVYKFFDKKLATTCAKNFSGSGVTRANKSVFKSEDILNEQLAEELHKPINRKFGKRKVYSSFKDNILGADLPDIQLISKFNKWRWFFLCVIDISSKYAWVFALKDKKVITNTNTFQKILDESSRKINKIWVDQGSEFYHKSVKSWLQDNKTEKHSTHNEAESVLLKNLLELWRIKPTKIWLQNRKMKMRILLN